jgi:hypothetical protein
MHAALIIIESRSHYSMQMCIPESLKERVLSRYHAYFLYSGQTCIEQSSRNSMRRPSLAQDVEHLCSTCLSISQQVT